MDALRKTSEMPMNATRSIAGSFRTCSFFRVLLGTLCFFFFPVFPALVYAENARSNVQEVSQVAVDALIYDLKNPNVTRRKDAAVLLGKSKSPRAVPALVEAANDRDASVRREIVLALDTLRDMRSLPAFLSLLNDSEKDIREKCIHGIINLYLPQETGLVVRLTKVANLINPWSDEWADVVIEPGVTVDPAVTTALGQHLQDSDEGIRVKAARALGILKGKEAIPQILQGLREDRSNTVRFEIIRSLRKIGDPSVGRELMNYLTYNDSKIRNEAVFTLGRFRYKEAAPELNRLYERESRLSRKEMDKTFRARLLEALAFIAEPSSKELFVKEKQNPDDDIRLHANEGLARAGDPALVTEISRDRIHEKDPKVRTAEAFALYRMGRKEFLDEVVNSLADRHAHNEAKQYLVELRPDELPDLYAQVRNQDVDVRESLAEVLGLVGDNGAIPYLQELSKDTRGQIAALANQGQRRIMARNPSQ
ncbi:MAG: hypothetical protein DMG10_13575 [Acidobacteria bacterium]|nr:MAG: hypothetical protein DMG10_13575 [Acidobacteriota bacterium]